LLSLYFIIYTFKITFPFFTGQSTPLTKLSRIFFSFPYVSIYTLDKTLSLEGEKAQNGGGKVESKTMAGNLSPKLRGSCTRFWYQIWGERSRCKYKPVINSNQQ